MSNDMQILIVDDEDSIADMIADALRDEGYTVLVAYDGRRGLELARSYQPSLILSDVMMPFMDGLKMAELLQHEVDHLDGILTLDHLSPEARTRAEAEARAGAAR